MENLISFRELKRLGVKNHFNLDGCNKRWDFNDNQKLCTHGYKKDMKVYFAILLPEILLLLGKLNYFAVKSCKFKAKEELTSIQYTHTWYL